ncbi:type VII secretion protein EccCb [Mycolicibacterium sp. P1-5]|uniref:type VII secretion protein EccCb n=1 Tax=Mycolicibacterium sp. P1-5 TaxID=2024617 RepID=UPI0011EBF0C5|nr:type VII secretion protein EccCb [Mycolicibacterium sp. P1-5]KAA0105161.1 type VII secretion protein EccCb [Mycolicibacterium sp. P1-5]
MNRSARLVPEFPTDDLVVAAPPRSEAPTGISRFMPLVGIAGMAGVGALVWGSGMASRGPTAVVLPAMMVVSAIGMALHAGTRGSAGSLDQRRRRYLCHLDRLSEQLCEAAKRQHAVLLRVHPSPASLWTLVGGPAMWDRSEVDSDFCHVRIGVGRQRLARRIVVPPLGPVDELDPVTADALRRFVRGYATLDDVPFAVALRGTGVLVVEGDPGGVRSLVRAMVCQLAVSHSPRTVAISAMVDAERREHWEWLKWLPHNTEPDFRGRRRVLVVDGVDHRSHLGPGTTVLIVGEVGHASDALRLRVEGDKLAVRAGECIEEFATADGITTAQAQICARRLARFGDRDPEPDVSYVDADPLWRQLPAPERLRVMLGTSTEGERVVLDIKEAADGGHGPHGLCVGATGSGKSELLRTIAAGMIVRHSPDELNLVLIDFKGGATFLGLEKLHHVSAVITNLADAAPMVMRAKDALGGEIHRRQQLLRRAGNSVNLAAYHRRRRVDPSLPVLPTLFVIVDEFAELLAQQPDFAELFTMIGRIGRSLGVHLLLASQRLDEGRLRGLESHLSYRICLKTATAAESRAVLGVADAAELPAAPGAAILRTGDGRLVRFQATYLGGPAPRRAEGAPSAATGRLFTSERAALPASAEAAELRETALDAIVDRFQCQGNPAHRLWLPPLTKSSNLAELEPVAAGDLTAAIGLIDLPFEQRQAPIVVDLAGALGNVAVVGAPRSGKSTTVCTLTTALAARNAPRRIQFYGIDFGGGALDAIRGLPHVGSVADRRESELVRRTVIHVGAILSARESRVSADEFGDVFLVVDGWSTLREEYPDLETVITGIATRGLSFGIHLILTAGRWADIRPALKDQIGTRVELRLGDPIDSEMDRKQAALVPIGVPGRGITRDGNHFLIATPDGVEVECDESWRAPAVQLLPAFVEHSRVVGLAHDDCDRILLGLGEEHFAPVAVDVSRQAHLLVLGDRECGKTATLRTLCNEIIRGATAEPALLFVVDYRRDLLAIADSPHVLGYTFSEHPLAERLPAVISLLQARLPGAETSIEQLRAGSWWSGPEIFVVVDDYDIVVATSPDALSPLLVLLPHAADIGLHMVVARRCAGSGRAMFDPLLAQLRDSGSSVLLMSGSPEEGPLVGHHRATAQPPGRGLLVDRAGARVIQVGWCPA